MLFDDPKTLASYLSGCENPPHPVHVCTNRSGTEFPDAAYIVLDIEFKHFNEASIAAGISLLVNQLGIFEYYEQDGHAFKDVIVLDKSGAASLDESKTVLCDLTGKMPNALAPASFVFHEPRGAFAGDKVEIWKYGGHMCYLVPFRANMFMSSQVATAQMQVVLALLGQVKQDEIAHANPEKLYARISDIFDALFVGNAELPVTQSEFEEFHEHVSFLAANPQATPKLMTTEPFVLEALPSVKGKVDALEEMVCIIRGVSQLWSKACKESGAGITNLASFSHMMMSEEKMPLDIPMRKSLAGLLGLDSAIDAYLAGVPMEDLLA